MNRAQRLAEAVAKSEGAAADGLPRNVFARVLYLRLRETESGSLAMRWRHGSLRSPLRRGLLTCVWLFMRLTGIEKRYSVHFD